MKKILLILSSIFFLSLKMHSQGQDYTTAIGFRLPMGLNAKMFQSNTVAIDASVGFWDWSYGSGFSLLGLYEIHQSLEPKNLRLYYGGGASVGLWANNWYHKGIYVPGGGGYVGIHGVVGIEYAIKEIPVCISFDLLPGIRIGSNTGVTFGAGLSLRYILK